MKVWLRENNISQLMAVANRMELEGDELVRSLEDNPNVVLTEKRTGLPEFGVREILEETRKPDAFLTRWFDYCNTWGNQVMVGFPAEGFMNDDLGPEVVSGYASRYSDSPELRKPFEKETAFLKKIKYTGFVTLGCSVLSLEIVFKMLGIPYMGIFNALEGVQGKISDFLIDPFTNRLQESWVVSILLTRPRYPYALSGNKVSYEIPKNALPHYWAFSPIFNGTTCTPGTVLGVASAWSTKLKEANSRAVFTCSKINVKEKQYRTDVHKTAQLRWKTLKETLAGN